MIRRDAFSSYHPFINFGFFAAVIVFGMIFMHPFYLLLSFAASAAYAVYIRGAKALRFILRFPLPMIILAGLINAAFTHKGVTVLFWWKTSPITLEAMMYGLASGLMFGSMILWFYSYNEVMTSDKFMYIFGRLIPSLSLIFSMVLRFIPRYGAEIRVISNAQKCIGRDVSNGSFRDKVKHGARIVSIMTTWALENAIDTADSMKSRGYGLSGRSSYSIYRPDKRDLRAGGLLAAAVALTVTGTALGINRCWYYPAFCFSGVGTGQRPFAGALFLTVYALLCFMPLIINLREDLEWRRQSAERRPA